jgi:glycosyltransferase involved in cell wall biosynthesis
MRLLIHDYVGHPFQVQLSRELARRGHQVTHAYAGGLVTPRGALQRQPGDPDTFDSIEVPMSPEYRANKYSFLKRRNFEVEYGSQLASTVKRLRPDLVLSGNTPTEPQWQLVRTATALRIPVVHWLQDVYSVAVDKLARRKLPLVGALAGKWYRHLDARCLRQSAHVVAITEDFRALLSEFGVRPERITVIPNWAPLDELPLRGRSNPWSSRHGLDSAFTFHYSGTLAMKHNPDLLRQLAIHFRDDPDVKIVVVTEGPGADFLAERKKAEHLDNLILLPFQPFADMPDMLAAADVLIAVLEPEAGVFSVPSKVLTYHCARRAILGAIPEENLAARIINEQGSGFCVGPGDATSFVNAASRLRRETDTRNQMAERGRAYATREFDLPRITDRFELMFGRAKAESLA